jgi:hypothetical protein
MLQFCLHNVPDYSATVKRYVFKSVYDIATRHQPHKYFMFLTHGHSIPYFIGYNGHTSIVRT